MAKFEKKRQAQNLRRKGFSIKEIAILLSVSKSSVSLWVREISLTTKQRNRLKARMIKAGHKGRMIGAEKNRKNKEEKIAHYKDEGKKIMNSLSKRDLLMVGLGLYWGEGSKSGQLSFTNSDPKMIVFMSNWFKKVMGISKPEFMPRIFINKIHKEREKKIFQFWSKLLNIPEAQFQNITYLDVRNKKQYDNYDDYYGVLALRIRKSTDLKYKILGLIEGLKDCSIVTH